jgi:CBS domain-containing protein
MKAIEIMTKNVVTIRGSAPVARAIKIMREKKISTLIVERRHSEDAYGIVTEGDIVNKVLAYGHNPKEIRVYEIMTKPCITINPDLGIEYVARLFANTDIRSAPVIKEDLIGIISAQDLLNKADIEGTTKVQGLTQEIEEAIAAAIKLCQEQGYTDECRLAWQKVEDLQVEVAHQQGAKLNKTALEEYCEENPEATDSLMLENWCSG